MFSRTCRRTSRHLGVVRHDPFVDDADLVADVGQLRQDVAGDDDRLAHLAQPPQQVAHLDTGSRIEAAERFVQQQHLRIVQQHAGQSQPLRLAARQRVGIRVALEVQVDDLQHLVTDAADAAGR